KVAGRLFSRTANQRKALLRGLVASLFEHQRIETTVAKAKAIKGIAEKLVTFGKRGDLHAKRMVMSYVPNRAVMSKLFSDIAPRFADRNGGYLRIIQTRQRVNDQAPMAIIEFVDYEDVKAKTAAKGDAKATEKKADKKPVKPKKETKKTAEAKPKKSAAKAEKEGEEKPKKSRTKKTAE
ncbi:MAG TPA: 50S ribosomal protein L17, partial [Dissulfurispiraceae bacterium]|nr:50S ribosomal protein L17 [Dissulfurispiraceae bacterium]